MRWKLIVLLSTALFVLPLTIVAASAETHEVLMLNKDPNDKKKRNVFIPAVIRIKPGDTVKFVSGDKGHNTESMKGMIPEGAKPWKSKVSKDFELTFDKPGVYGYRCTPHYTLGMVGIVIVEGEGWDANLEAAMGVKQRGKSKKILEGLWAEVDNLMQ
ncbi:MAG: pseudoazurin [Hyphomicrobiaceae bacterium]|nr:pseudoazurin [Hyphomicrobiaceae bacterium]